MLVLGHVGITAAAIRWWDRQADLRAISLAALLPDIIDKSALLLAPGLVHGWSRLAGHSLTGLCVFAAIAAITVGRRAPALVLAYAMHLALDQMWESPPAIVFWPWLGFTLPDTPLLTLRERILEPITIYGEVAGLICLLVIAIRERMCSTGIGRAFVTSGLIARRPM